MEIKEFIKLVKKMRERQREYFRGNKECLVECRQLEHAVDMELRRRLSNNLFKEQDD
jgi:hypothetical protein